MHLAELLQTVIARRASDLHLVAGREAMLRIDGQLHAHGQALTETQMHEILREMLPREAQADFKHARDLDFAFPYGTLARFRANVFQTENGLAAVLRHIPVRIPTLEEIGAPPIAQDLIRLERGLILVTGPTGSGKSTLLAALVGELNRTAKRHILTIEDPIEFVHAKGNCLITQREVGRHTDSFARALKSALREDPDVIVVGDMRDRETISLALTAAETGHLVIATLHTNSAAKTVDRVIDVFPPEDKAQVRGMLASSLEAVIAQALLQKKDGGRVAAREILVATPAIRNLIRENQLMQIPSMLQVGRKFGMQTLADAIAALDAEGQLAAGEAERLLARAEGAGEGVKPARRA